MAEIERATEGLPQSAVAGDEPPADVPQAVREAAFDGEPGAEREVERAWDEAQPMKGEAPTG
jgi:hypothetical protein